MSPERILYLLAVIVGIGCLVKIVSRRQRQLYDLLCQYVESQMEWSRKRSRAALIARRAALQKSGADDELSQLTKMIHDETSERPQLEREPQRA